MVLLGILLIAAGILILALGRFPYANAVGLIVAVAGVVVILAAVLDDGSVNAATVLALPPALRWHNLRYEFDKRLDKLCLWLATLFPARLRMWVVVDSTNTARRLYPEPDGYAGPDGLGYRHIYDGARRERV